MANTATRSHRNAFQLKITLRYIARPIWRRLLALDNLTLGQLHGLIQRAMGWSGGHLHEFQMPARGFGPPLRTFGHDGEDVDDTLLRDVLVRKGQMLLYVLLAWCGKWDSEAFDLESVNRQFGP